MRQWNIFNVTILTGCDFFFLFFLMNINALFFFLYYLNLMLCMCFYICIELCPRKKGIIRGAKKYNKKWKKKKKKKKDPPTMMSWLRSLSLSFSPLGAEIVSWRKAYRFFNLLSPSLFVYNNFNFGLFWILQIQPVTFTTLDCWEMILNKKPFDPFIWYSRSHRALMQEKIVKWPKVHYFNERKRRVFFLVVME